MWAGIRSGKRQDRDPIRGGTGSGGRLSPGGNQAHTGVGTMGGSGSWVDGGRGWTGSSMDRYRGCI